MKAKHFFTFIILLVLLASQAFAMSDGPISFRLKWQPGEMFKYKFDIRSDASAGNQSAQAQITFEVGLRVMAPQNTADSTTSGTTQDKDGNSFALTGRLIEVGLEYGDLNMLIDASGRKIKITIGKENVYATLNGNPVPSSNLDDLRREVKSFQDLLKAPIRLSMTDSGRIVRVTGLEKIDPAMQKELAMDFLQTMLLPEKPMKIGDQFKETRSLESLFPKQPGQSQNPLAGRTLEILRTLKEIRRGNNGKILAEFVAPLKEKFNDVPLSTNGEIGSVEMNMLYTTVYAVDHGSIVRETGKGTLLLRPRGGNRPSLVTVNVNATIELVESRVSKTDVFGQRRDQR